MPTADPILVVENIVKRFETRDGVLTAVDDVSFNVVDGEFLSVIGPSGCGKSTLFNVIGGLMGGYDGRVMVGGETIRGPHASIGMIFQEESTFPWRSVIDNVAFPLEIAGMGKAERIERARHFIDLVGLNGFERRYPSELSGGMKKRAGLARALALDPEVVFLDEPTAGLDPISANMFDELVKDLQRSLNLTVFMVTHDLDTLKATTDRIAVLVNKKIKVGTIAELRKDPDPWIQDYFAGARGRAALDS